MCGIFVAINKQEKKINIDKCKKSLNELKRRGPDWSFYKVINNIFFGQTVLSMTGENKQDINNHFSKSKNFFVTFNGEIYNYKDLASQNNFSDKLPDTKIFVDLFDKNEKKKY